jgi:hypothetical protein
MTTASTTFALATDEQADAWRAGNNDGMGYAPGADVEAAADKAANGGRWTDDGMPGPTQPNEARTDAIFCDAAGRIAVAWSDAGTDSGWWAVDITPYLA